MSAPLAIAVQRTENGKITSEPNRRPVSVTMRGQGSCPTTCPLLGAGCYAESGPQGIHTARLNRVRRGTPEAYARATACAIEGLRAVGQPLRIDIVGDDATPQAAGITGRAAAAFRERGGGPVWKYSHSWRGIPRNSWGGALAILASVESARDGLAALERGYAPARVIGRFPELRERDAFEVRWIPCPAQVGESDCEHCRLCTHGDRLAEQGAGILFEAHGSGAAKVRKTIASL